MTPRMTHFQRFRMTVEFVSPVHVGSGHSIEPYEYDIQRSGEHAFLVLYDLVKVLTDLSPVARREFDAVLTRGDFAGVRSWLRKHADPIRHRLYQIQVQDVSEAFQSIERHLNGAQRTLAIELFTRHAATGVPYVPGSSVKGAIRTAVLAKLATERQHRGSLKEAARRGGQRFEAALQDAVHTNGGPDLYRDPFRQLAISDIDLNADSCYIDLIKIVRAIGRREQESDPGDIIMYRDVTWSELDSTDLKYTTEARILSHLNNPIVGDSNRVPYALTIDRLIRDCNEFYLPKLDSELKRFPAPEWVAEGLTKATSAMKSNQCLIRLGRHHHWDCGVIKEFAQEPKRGVNKSRSFVNGELPLGWTRLTFDPWP